MGNFFQDVLGDSMISGGIMTVSVKTVLYVDGFATHETKSKKFKARKSIQPLTPDEAQLMGFGDYGTNEFITIYSLKKLPMPSKKGEAIVVHFNNKDWYVRRVLPWVWNEGTPMELGYYEVTLSRFNENEVNPN
jgi:hypothetical protein